MTLFRHKTTHRAYGSHSSMERGLLIALCLIMAFPFGYFSPRAQAAVAMQDPDPAPNTYPPLDPPPFLSDPPPPPEPVSEQEPIPPDSLVYDNLEIAIPVKLDHEEYDSIPPTEVRAADYAYDENGKIPFDPSPTRAVWLSVLCPGLGQIYNRRYWKLPIVIGGFMGLAYATNWNNTQYQDYMQGYRDLLDSDPQTKSYMDFFPSTVKEEDLDKSWLESTFKYRKDYARRYRDLCIIGLVALYALCILDAYVDASLTHFDVSPDLSVDWTPTLLPDPATKGKPAIGLNWAFTF